MIYLIFRPLLTQEKSGHLKFKRTAKKILKTQTIDSESNKDKLFLKTKSPQTNFRLFFAN
jgi:hypothetical protein